MGRGKNSAEERHRYRKPLRAAYARSATRVQKMGICRYGTAMAGRQKMGAASSKPAF